MQGQPCTLQALTGQASTLYGQAVKAVCANPTGTDANFHGASLQMRVCLALRMCLGIPAFFPDIERNTTMGNTKKDWTMSAWNRPILTPEAVMRLYNLRNPDDKISSRQRCEQIIKTAEIRLARGLADCPEIWDFIDSSESIPTPSRHNRECLSAILG